MVKCVEDYIPQLKEIFPNVRESDMLTIINYGWRLFYYYNLRGCDVIINTKKNKKLWFYCGSLKCDSVRYYEYYRKKLQRKLNVLKLKKKIKWDGYYYIGVSKEQYKEISETLTLPPNIYPLKSFDELQVYYTQPGYLFKFKYVDEEKRSITKPIVVGVLDKPLTFKDALVSTKKYTIL